MHLHYATLPYIVLNVMYTHVNMKICMHMNIFSLYEMLLKDITRGVVFDILCLFELMQSWICIVLAVYVHTILHVL